MARDGNYDDHRKLLHPEAHKPYLTEEESERLVGGDIEHEMELDELTTTLENEGIDVLPAGEMPSQRLRKLSQDLDESEEVDLSESIDELDKTNDPVRLYLRQMGTVPLLTRQGEIDIAKRFERGHFRVLKAISRSPLAIQEVIALSSVLERGARSIKEVVYNSGNCASATTCIMIRREQVPD